MKNTNKTNTKNAFFGLTLVGALVFTFGVSFPSIKPVAPTQTDYHFNATLQFDDGDQARSWYPLPIEGDAVVQCTVSDEWATNAIATCQWLDEVDLLSVTVNNNVSSTLPVDVNVSVFPANYTPLVSEGK